MELFGGMASKAISGIMDSMGYDIEPTFGKSMINIVLSGMASKASGGDFVQGAMSAMVVWLYNDAFPHSKSEIARRQKIVENYARSIINNKAVDIKLRQRLSTILDQGKLKYVDNDYRPANDWKKGSYFGYSRSRNRLGITTKNWLNNGQVWRYQIVNVMIHEVYHKIWGGKADYHPKEFMQYVWDQTQNYFYSIGESNLYDINQPIRDGEAKFYSTHDGGW